MQPPAIRAAQALISEFIAQGLRDIVLAPGSRSAPLAYAAMQAARAGLVRLHVRIDERSAAFLALGIANGDRALHPEEAKIIPPVALITTSGTAVANTFPAIMEASHSGLPLLILSADRPTYYHLAGANQATDQSGIFAKHTRLEIDLPLPQGIENELDVVRNLAVRSYHAASGSRSHRPGPVHLNIPYQEPLTPNEPLARDHLYKSPLPGKPKVHVSLKPVPARGVPFSEYSLGQFPVVIAGTGAPKQATVVAWRQQAPLIAEVTSGLAAGENWVKASSLILEASQVTKAEFIDPITDIIVYGRPTLDRGVKNLLNHPSARLWIVDPNPENWFDAGAGGHQVLVQTPEAWTNQKITPTETAQWLKQWQVMSKKASRAVEKTINSDLKSAPKSFGAYRMISTLAKTLSPSDVLVVGPSNPVRDLDLLASWEHSPVIVTNRGLAGIDGMISTAIGVSLATRRDGSRAVQRVVRALVGDLTFLHDVGGLLRGPYESEVQLQIIVINDNGGSIFAGIEHGRQGDEETFERVFATPHGVSLGEVCSGYGVGHQLIRTQEELKAALQNPLDTVSVLEVIVPRDDREFAHQHLLQQVKKIS